MNSIDNLIAVDNSRINKKVIKNEINFIKKLRKICYSVTKRTFDILCSIVGIVGMLLLAIPIKISYVLNGDFSSIFFIQIRIGKDGKKFNFYKFRTMVTNADDVLNELLKEEKYKIQWKKNQKIQDDPRITKAGKFLRDSSLDELPQFINILKGDMSLIGPRPLVENELDNHNGIHEIYESVKPGLTSWWACNGRSDISYDERLNLEYYYIEHAGIMMDMKCIFKTIKAVVFKVGVK